MRIGLFFIATLIVVGCNDDVRNEIYNENNTSIVDGVVLDVDDHPISGIYRTYYADGAVKMEMQSEGGKPDGYGKFYNADGVLAYSGYFKKGVLDGELYSYFDNGQVQNEMNYENGLRHGIQKIFDENGNLRVEVEYNHGIAVRGYAVVNGSQAEFSTEELAKLK